VAHLRRQSSIETSADLPLIHVGRIQYGGSKLERYSSVRLLLTVSTLALSIASICTIVSSPVQARWKPEYANSPYREWYSKQTNGRGEICCDESDAAAVYDAYIKNGKWYVPIDGIHHAIEPYQLLDGPNPTGRAVVWYDGWGDIAEIYCFAPGPQS